MSHLTCLVKGFQIGPPSRGLNFKSLDFQMVISSLCCSLITSCKISDLYLLGRPEKLFVSK